MLWKKFPFPNSAFAHDPNSLKAAWARLHAGDDEPFPENHLLIAAWIAFHSGEFEKAINLGLKAGVDGYAVANKANCIYAHYLEKSNERKLQFYIEISSRCDVQQSIYPQLASGYYWQAYALTRYAHIISLQKAFEQGIAKKEKECLDKTIALAPKHADAHTALGSYQAKIISQLGGLVSGISYGVSKENSISLFQKALELNKASACARIDFAHGLVMLYGKNKIAEALRLCREAATLDPTDAHERLDVQLAFNEINES